MIVLLAAIGGGTVLMLAGTAGVSLLRNQPPDHLRELVSPDGRYRLVITEKLAGFPGSVCIKQVFVLRVQDRLDQNDEDTQVFDGACDGLSSIEWNGVGIRGTVAPNAALEGVNHLTLKRYGANGKVAVNWTGR